jgi:HAD superfamily hydrolase (TIGR01509 family)
MTRPRPKALFFGAIGTLAETSELQRRAYNAAFAQAGLDWTWSPDRYRDLLRDPGGTRRIAAEARRRGVVVDAEAIHRCKVTNFRNIVQAEGLTPRPGVLETLDRARGHGLCIGWVTTTGRDTVDLMLEGFGGAISAATFDFICDARNVGRPKPAPDIYLLALERAGVAPRDARAVEDTPESAAAAVAAGLPTIATPGWAAQDRSFPDAVHVVPALSPAVLG